MSIINHPFWPQLKPYCIIETYDRDGSANDPRVRIEFKKLPKTLTEQARSLTVDCASCGETINPIRARNSSAKRGSSGHLYYAATCPLHKNIGCSRGKAAKEEYILVKENVRGT